MSHKQGEEAEGKYLPIGPKNPAKVASRQVGKAGMKCDYSSQRMYLGAHLRCIPMRAPMAAFELASLKYRERPASMA